MQRVLVTGGRGLLGARVVAHAPAGVAAWAPSRATLELSDPDAVRRALTGIDTPGVDAVLHCAAATDVDGVEADPARATRDNVTATANLARACAARDVPLVVLSTDYVFDGRAERPYRENDAPAPLGVYGRTKLAAERAATDLHPRGTRVLRTAWLLGDGPFERWMAAQAALENPRPFPVVADQWGSPTSADALAPLVWSALDLPRGTWHLAGPTVCTWLDVARALLRRAGRDPDLARPGTLTALDRPAPRPRFCALDSSRAAAHGLQLPEVL